LVGDIKDPASYRPVADACDVLVHAAFEYTPQGPDADRAALRALMASAKAAKAPRLLIYTSGVWVLGPQKGQPADETAPLNPIPAVAWRPAHEALALEAAGGQVSAVVVRPGCVYGEKGGLYGMMIQSAIDAHKITVIDGGKNCWASVYLDDVAELYRLIVERRPEKALYHATDGTAEPMRELADALLDAAGGGALEDITLEAARWRFGPSADGWAIDQRVSSDKARSELGWKPLQPSLVKDPIKLLMQWKEQTGPVSVA
jgi:nucleoside-diphosphate-sugar epimerase